MTTTVIVQAHCNPETEVVRVSITGYKHEFMLDGEERQFHVHDDHLLRVQELNCERHGLSVEEILSERAEASSSADDAPATGEGSEDTGAQDGDDSDDDEGDDDPKGEGSEGADDQESEDDPPAGEPANKAPAKRRARTRAK